MKKINLIAAIYLFCCPLFALDSYFVKDPPASFFEKYYSNLFHWSKTAVLNLKESESQSLDNCFKEWQGDEVSKKKYYGNNKVLRPMFFEFERSNNEKSWSLVLLAENGLNCLKGAVGARWSLSGEIISRFYSNKKPQSCSLSKKENSLYEVRKQECLVWKIGEIKVAENIIQEFRSYAKLEIQSAQKKEDFYFFKAFEVLVLKDIDRKVLERFKYDWKALVHGIYFDSKGDYRLIIP